MPSPFPGMDPYLENPGRWPDVHARFIAVIGEVLGAALRPKYLVRIEERVYLSDEADPGRAVMIPDLTVAITSGAGLRDRESIAPSATTVAEPIVELTLIEDEVVERFLQITDREDRSVVAVIEVVSPVNKTAGSRGLASFSQKRREVMGSQTHWIEIDLLRQGVSPGFRRGHEAHEYMVHVSPVTLRPQGLLWLIRLSQPLPVIQIPLRGEDHASLDLQEVLKTVYDRAGYDLEIDYRAEPVPPLSEPWASWADGLLKQKGLRKA